MFSLSGKMDFPLPSFQCAMKTLIQGIQTMQHKNYYHNSKSTTISLLAIIAKYGFQLENKIVVSSIVEVSNKVR